MQAWRARDLGTKMQNVDLFQIHFILQALRLSGPSFEFGRQQGINCSLIELCTLSALSTVRKIAVIIMHSSQLSSYLVLSRSANGAVSQTRTRTQDQSARKKKKNKTKNTHMHAHIQIKLFRMSPFKISSPQNVENHFSQK